MVTVNVDGYDDNYDDTNDDDNDNYNTNYIWLGLKFVFKTIT